MGARHTFTASDGVAWTVSEYVESSDSTTEVRYLIFECDMVIRRVRTFPRDWRELGFDALFALSWAR